MATYFYMHVIDLVYNMPWCDAPNLCRMCLLASPAAQQCYSHALAISLVLTVNWFNGYARG